MEVKIIRSKRKTVSLAVTRAGEAVVRAPMRMPEESIRRFVDQHREWLETHLAIAEERNLRHPTPTPEEETALRRRAKEVIPPRVAELARHMGVTYTGVKINFAKTRFGSCSGKNSLNFSARLMQYSPRAVDYVIIHELAHTLEHNHSARFWQIVAQYMPDYRQAQQELKT